jgi:hypothetical protein
MDRHLDFTIDFETCSLSANAAVMQVAVVPWMRDADADPLDIPSGHEPFVAYVDLRTCVVDGFDFDMDTVRWWASRSKEARQAVTRGLAEPIRDVLFGMLDYIEGIARKEDLSSLCLWCQGMDVDIAILRNICRKYGVDLEAVVPHTSFRDCRTLILETAAITGWPSVLVNPRTAYDIYNPLPEAYAGETHDALYDARRSSWYTWQALRHIVNPQRDQTT